MELPFFSGSCGRRKEGRYRQEGACFCAGMSTGRRVVEDGIMLMLNKLREIESRYEELNIQLSTPEIIADTQLYQKTAKAHSELAAIVDKFRQWKNLEKSLAETKGMLEEEKAEPDPELRALAEEECATLERKRDQAECELKLLLVPKDPNDEKNVVLEIRAGTGGDEATLFAQEVFRMYCRYAESQGWRVEMLSSSYSGIGGLKEVIAMIEGAGVYSKMKYESGVHRVQRVPQTEQQGRVHTSAVTVAVLPEADEVEVAVDPKEIRIDTFCSSGPGGQSVNTTYSAVRITHQPTGLVVSCQDEKSQIKNKAKAMRVLRSRLLAMEQEKQHNALAQERKAMVGSGDRSEKIRTYNFPQNRLTDHRIGLTLYQLDSVMEGRLGPVLEPLVTHYQAEKLKAEMVTA